MATIDRYSNVGADINIKRSRFPLNRRTIHSYMHGYLQPIGTPIEVLPGDTLKAVISAYTRMSTPIVPFIDNIRQEIDAFFVPKRILWNKTKQFYGESPSFGIASPVLEPSCSIYTSVSDLSTNLLKCESFAAAFGLIPDAYSSADEEELNVLPIRSFLACYNEFYRNENYQDQYTWNKDAAGTVGEIGYLGAASVGALSYLPKVNKDRDLITSVLPYQIKGAPVMLGLAGNAPVITGDINTDLATLSTGNAPKLVSGVKPIEFGVDGTWSVNGGSRGFSLNGKSVSSKGHAFGVVDTTDTTNVNNLNSAPINLYADLSNVAAVSISNLLYAFAYQDFLARAAHFGTRYKEYIYSMFGTTIADATEDIPEYLGRLKFNINVNQVVQTTGFAASSSTSLGSLGAYSTSGASGKLFTKSFTEPGYIVLVTYTKHQRTYSSGIDRTWLKKELLDYYQPPFANIADIPFEKSNIWFTDVLATNTSSVGFQEPWFEYRSLQDRAYGMMNPKVDTLGQIWTLADKYSAAPTIGAAYMQEDRDAIARVLATGVNGPDYLMDFLLEIDATRVMPLFSSGKLGRF